MTYPCSVVALAMAAHSESHSKRGLLLDLMKESISGGSGYCL